MFTQCICDCLRDENFTLDHHKRPSDPDFKHLHEDGHEANVLNRAGLILLVEQHKVGQKWSCNKTANMDKHYAK